MQKFRTLILAGAAIAAIVGAAAAEPTKAPNRTHVLTVRLPDGSLEKIRYTGDQPPAVDIAPSPGDQAFLPVFDDFWSPFADFERMSAALDREAAAMADEGSRLANMGYGNPDGLFNIDFGRLPAGTQGYATVSTLSGNGFCTRTTKYFLAGKGKPPRVETKSSGNCAPAAAVRQRSIKAVKPMHQTKPDSNSDLIQASYKSGDAEMAKLD